MSTEQMDGLARRGAERLRATIADLVDDGQVLMRDKLGEAADILQYTREQAAETARDTLDKARSRAQGSMVELEHWASRRPLAATAVAMGIGILVGLALNMGRTRIVAPREAPPEPKPVTVRRPSRAKTH